MEHMHAETLLETREFLEDIRDAAHGTSRGDLDAPAMVLLQLVDLLQSWQKSDSPAAETKELAELVDQAMAALRSSLIDESAPSQEVEQLIARAVDRWGEHLAETDEASFDARLDDGWHRFSDSENSRVASCSADPCDDGGSDATGAELASPSEQVIQDLLAQLTGLAASSTPSEDGSAAEAAFAPPEVFDIPDELREAFLDDAGRCVSSIEEALLLFEANPKYREPLQQICRELHTLKGASGSVGLMSLANYLHEFEDSLRDSNTAKCALPSIESLFSTVDSIRKQIEAVAAPAAADGEEPQQPDGAGDSAPRTPAPSPLGKFADAGGDEESVRVKSSQLNRLMDMLAELVMLRNRRDSELSELKEVHSELIHSVSRLRSLGDGVGAETGSVPANPLPRLTEVANDVLESAQRLRGCYQPVAEGNLAVSQFIRQFRQELVELRRMPVSGLFRRLQRVASDAARAEHKQVHLRLVGEDAGIERSLQERLYEPLLHIVRNAVSHGIEDGEERARKGKEPVGVVTLEAQTGADLLVLEIRDDGRGLNYDALRRRGTELGLLTPDKAATREELALLIFHPGFSTQATASHISGRGVGMDVVASAIARMRGWVEVDSTPGKGTTVRLTFPLPSVIQHTMVFRACGQLFALPMQFIQGAGGVDDSAHANGSHRAVHFGKLFGSADDDGDAASQMLVLSSETPASTATSTATASDANPRRLELLVDEIVGPEEVVVRPLPSLLKHHPLCSGATLSGMGEVVLVLDKHRLTELAVRRTSHLKPSPSASRRPAAQALSADPQRPSVLVVDDSISARKRLVRSLRRYGVEVTEASDGAEAAERLKTGSYAAVFSDLEMPRQSGFELLTEIRAVHDANALPVLIISSRTEDELRIRATELGAQAYLVKPLSDEALDSAIANIPTISAALLARETREVQ